MHISQILLLLISRFHGVNPPRKQITLQLFIILNDRVQGNAKHSS